MMNRLRSIFVGIGLFACGGGTGAALLYAYQELPYRNALDCAKPLDAEPLIVRNDDRGKGAFGTSRNGGRRHKGVDLQAPEGSPVYAIRSGRVLEAGTHKGLGNYVKILHDDKITSLYAHLNTIEVKAGQRVPQSAQIGTVGKTGNANHPLMSPHVHLETAKGGVVMDPAELGLEYVNTLDEGT